MIEVKANATPEGAALGHVCGGTNAELWEDGKFLAYATPENAARIQYRLTRQVLEQQLVAYQHNGFSIMVHGNPEGIAQLKELLIPNKMVKSILVYGGEPLAMLSSLNYSQLKELRKNG